MLCAGDFEKLQWHIRLVHTQAYKVLLSACSSDRSTMSEDGVNQPIRLQQPNLCNLETDKHLEQAELIADVEKKFADDVYRISLL